MIIVFPNHVFSIDYDEFDSNELNSEPANQKGNAPRTRRMAAVNPDLIRQLNYY